MEYEAIIKEFKSGHSKKWLIDEEYKSLIWLKKNRGAFKYSKAKEIKEEACEILKKHFLNGGKKKY